MIVTEKESVCANSHRGKCRCPMDAAFVAMDEFDPGARCRGGSTGRDRCGGG